MVGGSLGKRLVVGGSVSRWSVVLIKPDFLVFSKQSVVFYRTAFELCQTQIKINLDFVPVTCDMLSNNTWK